jgi:murein DD-endopeptidase MepM/ murein hydrolase activator NlpD
LKWNKLKNIKSFSVLIIPDHTGSESKSHKLTIQKLILIVCIYTLAVGFAGYLLISVTPIDKLFFSKSSVFSSDELEMVKELNLKMNFLMKELESLKSTNERLRYAIILGDSSLMDSLTRKKDSLRIDDRKIEGNIFAVLKKLIFPGEDKKEKSYYFSRPVSGFVSRAFNEDRGHLGIDYVAKIGTPVYSAANGFVIFSDYTVRDGNMIIISHPEQFISVYKHCSSLIKQERDIVIQGELIALSGNSGQITTGPHLHFEIWRNGKPIDPNTVLLNY